MASSSGSAGGGMGMGMRGVLQKQASQVMNTADFEYEGEKQALLPHGKGKAVWPSGKTYVGFWKEGMVPVELPSP
mgnify:CR=1 FL=1